MARHTIASAAHYWTDPPETVLTHFKTSAKGLSHNEAAARLRQYGPNELAHTNKHAWIVDLLATFLNPLVLILLFASLVSAFLGETTNFIIIATIVLLSVAMDWYQHYQAENAAEKLRKRVSLRSTVIREGQKQDIAATHIVPGDIIVLAAGNIIPADARILDSRELVVNQSALTGESFPQEKDALAKVHSKAVSERTNTVFMGTNVLSGEATAIVVQTGTASEFGQVAKQLVQKRPETDFERGVKDFGYLLLKVTFGLVILVFLINILFKHDLINSFLFALALAIGLTPELLPVIITVNLSKGAVRMAEKKVIVKDLPAIQNFGAMDILCTDKTGTLTEDKIRLERYEDIDADESNDVLLYGYVNAYFQTGLKSPMEQAVLAHKDLPIHQFTKVDEIPFDFQRRRLSVIVKHDAKYWLTVKGAPEFIFQEATHYKGKTAIHPFTPAVKAKIQKRFDELSQQGFRVLAVAVKEVKKEKQYSKTDEKDLVLYGLMAFLDPPKESAKEALQLLTQQGISLKILTGDNELVTQKICQEIGLAHEGSLTGEAVDALSDDALAKVAEKTAIFARLNPEQKKRIILALKKQGHVVGFLGDGINDAPSLRTADIGISVENAVDVAKESADLILLRKDLLVLKDGVYEGRRTYGNIMKYIMMGASSNFGNMFSVAGASLFIPFLPMLPVQILLNNLLYDVSELTVPSDHVDDEFLNTPKKWNVGFIRHFMFIFGPISSLFDFLTFGILILFFRASAPLFQTGWFVESIVTQLLIIFSIRTALVPFYRSKPSPILTLSCLGVVLVGLLLPFSPLAHAFGFVHLPVLFYGAIFAMVVAYFVLVEQIKTWFYRKYTI